MSASKKKRELNRAAVESDRARLSAEFAASRHAMLNIAESVLAKRVEELEKQVDDLSKWKWKNQLYAKMGVAIEEVARLLPEGFTIHVEVEKNAGWVSLYDPEGEEVEVPCEDYLYESVYIAIEIAKERAANENRA